MQQYTQYKTKRETIWLRIIDILAYDQDKRAHYGTIYFSVYYPDDSFVLAVLHLNNDRKYLFILGEFFYQEKAHLY